MRRLILFLILLPTIVYATPLGQIPNTSEVLQSVVEDTSPQLGGNLDMLGKHLFDSTGNLFSGSGIDTATISYHKIVRPVLSGPNRTTLNEFTVKQENRAVTGGVGISGATFVPEVDLLFMVDNNALNISIYHAGDVDGTEFGNITFSGFSDPECLEYLWTVYDANGKPDTAVFAVGEEQTNEIVLFEWDLQATSGTITKASWISINATNMFSTSATTGMEGMTYIPDINSLFVCKQLADECRIIPLNGSTTPAATEPFDAATVWAGSPPPNLNDLTYDRNTGLVIAIGDELSAANANIDIWAFDPFTGAQVEYLNNFPNSIGLTSANGWGQGEGIAISPDGQNLWISSEGNEVAWLTRASSSSSPFTSGSGLITKVTGTDVVNLTNATAGTTIDLRIIKDMGASDMAETDVACIDWRRFDNNELTSSQTNQHRARLCAVPFPDATYGAVQAESGANLRIETVLGSGTHGANTNVVNGYFNNLGHLILGPTITDLAAKLAIDGTADEIQQLIQGNGTQTAPMVTIETSAGTDAFLFDESGAMVPQVSTLTIADDGAGTSPVGSLTPTTSYAEITCNDANGCTLNFSETGARQGQMLNLVNVSANAVTLQDSAGVTESAASVLGQYDTAMIIYSSDRWIQHATNNN